MDPKFSVIIPAYNRVTTLGRAIESVLSQTFLAWEIIVVDDGSLDGTQELVKAYPPVIYHYQDNSGVCAARNKGAKLATGDWLVFLDSDDELINTSIEDFTKVICLNPDFSLFLSGYQRVEIYKSTFTDLPGKSQGYTPFLSGTYTVCREKFLNVGGFDEILKYSENMELLLRFSQYGIIPKIIQSMSLRYYQSSDGGSKNLKKMDDSISLILKKHEAKLSQSDLWNLHQTLGVIQLRRERFSAARTTLRKAISYRPTQLGTYLRYAISFLPFLSRRVYSSASFTS